MSKLKEIWRIIRRKDFKDGDEVHAVEFNGGLMVSNSLYERLKPELGSMSDAKYLGDLYSVKILSTPFLPYIYHKAKNARAASLIKEKT